MLSRRARSWSSGAACTLLTIFAITASLVYGKQPDHLQSDPFRSTDVVSLFARTAGTVRDPGVDGQPGDFESKRFEIYGGRPDAAHAAHGRLADGSWALIFPFADGTVGGTNAMVYRATTAGGIAPVGALHSPLDGIRVAIRNGYLTESFPIFHPTGTCAAAGREIRTYDARGGVLREIARRTDPADFIVTLDRRVPYDAAGHVEVDRLASHTKGLYRACVGVVRRERPYYLGDGVDLYGMPYAPEAVWFSEGTARFVAVPFVSGGTGGVFTAGVYRVDTGRVVLVRSLHTNGHLTMRAVRDTLEVASPLDEAGDKNCCYSHVDVTTYRYDPVSGRLVGIAVRRHVSTNLWMRGVRVVAS